MKENKITITTPDNKEIEVEVLDIFNVVGYEGKDYIMYTLGEKINEENEKVYISILMIEEIILLNYLKFQMKKNGKQYNKQSKKK